MTSTGFWSDLDAARSELEKEFRLWAVEYVVTFDHLPKDAVRPFYAWLFTETDDERDKLRGLTEVVTERHLARPDVVAEVHAVFERVAPATATALEGVAVESHETTDRDYEGSRFYVLR